MWHLVYKVEICGKCDGGVIIYRGEESFVDVRFKCERCNPSTDNVVYRWDEKERMWIYSHSAIKCPTCRRALDLSNFKLHYAKYFCKHCDPSSKHEKYIWSEDGKGWEFAYFMYTCPTCNEIANPDRKIEFENLRFHCKNCNPSGLSPLNKSIIDSGFGIHHVGIDSDEKYEWDNVEKMWVYSHYNITCHTCERTIKSCKSRKTFSNLICKYCDPGDPDVIAKCGKLVDYSVGVKKYFWDEIDEMWLYVYTAYKCSYCNKETKSRSRVEDKVVCESCKNVKNNENRRWDGKEWKTVYTLTKCPSCNKMLKVWDKDYLRRVSEKMKRNEGQVSYKDMVIHNHCCVDFPTKKLSL